MLRAARELWRRARSLPVARPLITATDRAWWAHVIRRAHIVDLEFVGAQLGSEISERQAIRAYVRGGHQRGLTLNPLACERTLARQLPERDRVPALYAYLVNSRERMTVSPNWDAVDYEDRHPAAINDPAGALGHAWRAARANGRFTLGVGPRAVTLPWATIHRSAVSAARSARSTSATPPGSPERGRDSGPRVHLAAVIASDETAADEALIAAAEATDSLNSSTIVAVTADADGRVHADTWVQAHLLALWHPEIEVVLQEIHQPVDWARRTAEERGSADVVVLRGPSERIDATGLAALARAGKHGAVSPLAITPAGVVSSAGIVTYRGRPTHLLSGFPAEDAQSLGTMIEVAAPGAVTRAFPRRGDSFTPRTLLTTAVVSSGTPPDSAAVEGVAEMDALLARSPLRLERWTDGGPILKRAKRVARLVDGSSVTSLRWAIKTAAPAGPEGQAWGDTHFANGIAAALRRLGQEVVVDAYPARHRPTSEIDDISLVLRGPRRIDPVPGGRWFLWIISHPDEISVEELSHFDRVFAASAPWAASASDSMSTQVTPLLQCTDSTLFHPAKRVRTEDIVFVGTARGIARPSVVAPIHAGIDVAVYGPDWRRFIPGRFIRAAGIAYSELPSRYETAAVVLNDHWPAMQAAGFISNRPYDVVAAGGRVISDLVEGLEKHFGGAVRTYETTDELIAMLRTDLNSLFPSPEALDVVSQRIRKEDSFDARARTLLDAALEALAD